MPFQAGGAAGVTTLSDLQIDVDKDWKAHGIYNLGDLTPKVDGAYSLGESDAKFDTVYAGLMPDSVYKRNLRTGVVDTSYLTDNAATSAKVGPSVDLEFVRSNDNTVAGDISTAADGAYNLGSSTAKFDTAYATSFPGMADLIYKTTPEVADIVYNTPTAAVPAGLLGGMGWSIPFSTDVLDHSNLGSAKAKDIVYHGNFNLPSAEARDKVAESTYGVAKDMTGVKGFTYQINEKRDFAFRTETPDHAYWHRMYNTPAAFETVYQNYTTSMQKKGTTPSKSAPGTADPNPQPGAVWSVSMPPDGTQVGHFVSPAPAPFCLAWDGTYIWNVDNNANFVYKLKTDGTTTGGGFTPPGTDTNGVGWDGAYLWCCDSSANYIYQLKTDGTETGGGFVSPGPAPVGIVWNGTYLWHSDNTADFIYKLRTDGTQTGGGFAPPQGALNGLGWDGTYLWNGSWGGGHIYQFKPDGTQVGAIAPFPRPYGAEWDGAYLWTTASTTGHIYRIGNAGNFDVNYRIFAK